ncbi:unnamed protein product [Sphagnum compactum]
MHSKVPAKERSSWHRAKSQTLMVVSSEQEQNLRSVLEKLSCHSMGRSPTLHNLGVAVMALRDTKTGQQQVTGDALLMLLQAPDSSGLASQLKLYVAPVNTVGAGGKENRSAAEWHACAKQYVPFLVKLLKLCTAEVARPPRGENDTAAWKKGDEVFAAMAIALDTLHLLRSFLVGCAFEIEIQRSGLVRRLMAWKKFAVALEQSRKNYLSLCCNVLAPTTKQGGLMVAAIKGKATGLPALVTGVVVDLIWCSGETGADSPECFQKLAILPQQLDPWLRMLDAGVIEGQRDALFRALHKCASLLVANPALYGAELVENFCLLTLQQLCNSPALCPQYAKVAWKMSSRLSCQGANFTRIALNVCEVAMEDILLRSELQCLSGSTDVLDLIDGYARLCLTANEGLQGWLHICQFVERCGQEFRLLAPAAGFYSVGLMLLIEETSEMEMKALGHLSNDRGCNNPQEKIHSACELLHAGAEAVENWLQQDTIPSSWPPFIEGGSGGNMGTQASKGVLEKTGVVAVEANHLLSALKAVDFIRRHSATYVQHEWTSFLSIAGSKSSEEGRNLTQSASFNSALQKVLHLCIPLLERCETLTCDEYLKKGWSVTSASMIAAFRLSLVHQQQQEIQTCITSINTLVSTSRLKPDDLHWLTSSIYNMGVHIFNTKLYKLACFPFEVANNVVWTRVSSNLTQPSEVAESMGQNSILRDLVSEGCAKCLTLADALARSGQHTVGLGVLVAGITRWAMVQTAMKPPGLKIPQVLVRSLVKMMHAESVLAAKLVTVDPPCLYTFLGSNLRHFQPCTLGLLMEEEMSALEELEASNLSYFQSTMERQLHLLLNNVYTAEEFPVERSRALQEKGRIARSSGNDGLATCVSCIIEAESVVNAALKDSQRTSSAVLLVASLEDQLATIYCIQALCAYETNPSGQDYIEKIVAALKLWKQSLEAQKKWSLLRTEDNAMSDCQEAGNGAASVGLLMNIFDLLSLKGFSPLQCEIQGLILEMTSVSQVHCSHEELCAALWANCRLGHVLCPVPFPAGFFSLVSQKLEVAGDSLMFWQNSALHCQGSLLDARQKLISQDFLDESCTYDGNCTEGVSGSSEFLENIALSQISTGRRNTHEALGLAGLFCLLADHEYGKGDIREAMKYAKKGLSLRLRTFTHAFVMVDKGMSCLNTEDSQSSPQSDRAEKNKVGRLEALGSAAITNWPRFTSSAKPVKFGPSQWRILGDYIESLMQVGVIHERMGAVDDAERSFREGQRLSLAHNMLLAQAAFSSCLGEVHRKRHLWELAESELCLARKIYDELDSGLVCGHCNLAGQALLALRFGDLARRRSDGNPIASQNLESDLDCFAEPSLMTWNDAKSCYKTSRDILGVLLSMSSVKCPCGMTDSAKIQANADDEALIGVKGTRRRMFLDTVNKMGNLAIEERALEQKLNLVEPERKSRDICDFNRQKHPQNVPSQEDNLLCNHRLQAPSSMQSWTEYVWVKHSHQLLARLIIQTGKLEQGFGSTEKAAEMYLQAKCVLGISLEPLSATTSCSDLPQDFFSSIQARKSPYPLEEAALLYHMSLLYLQRMQHSRSQGCDVGNFLPLAWLYQAFQLCSQIPPLLRKVARLLSLLHVPIVRGNFGLCRHDNMSRLKEQAAFFHQVSVGAGVQQQHLAVLDTRLAGLLSETDKALHYGSLKCCLQQMQQALSVPHLTIDTMQTAVRDMMKGIPCSTLCCISMVDSEHGFLLDKEQNDDAVDSVVGPAWLLLTRLSNSSGPLTVVLPVTSIVEDTSSNDGGGSQEGQTSCPYDLDISDAKPDQMQLQVGGSKTSNLMCLQRLVSGFQSILEESRQSTSGLLPLTAIENKSQWWQWRIQLDARLESLLRTMEDTWLGPWKCLFLGEPDATAILKEFQSNALELCSLLRSTSRARQEDGVEVPVDENQVQLLLQGVGTIKEKELELGIASILGDTNVGGRRNARKCRETSAKEAVVVERPSAPRGLSKVGDTDRCEFERQAMTLILDAGLQSLPWESLPVLRGHTTYRMPSLGSTCALTIHQQYVAAAAMFNPQICHGAQVGNTHADPLAGCPDQVTMQRVATIDLSSTYYLLNPSGDLEKTQCAFEDWFKQQQGWEGKAGQVPTVEEYMKALQKHDLFVYLGHGSGDQYLPERYIRTLDRCAAALLMGCSSGRLSPRGDYEPAGVPLSYLIASCPAAIANLWDVTDGDIDRFSRFLLHKWLNIDQPPLPPLVNDSLMKAVPTRLNSKSSEAALREMLQEQFTAKSGELPHARRNTKATERKLEFGIQQAEETRPRMVMCTAVGEARNSCRLPYLIGASPVYYGVPTSIQKIIDIHHI